MNFFRRLILFPPASLMLLIGCQPKQPAPPLPSPTTLFAVDYFLGTPLSGPIAGVAPTATPSSSAGAHVTFIALENLPATAYPPVGSRSVFFSSTGGGDAILPAAELTRNATITELKFAEDLPAALRSHGAGRTTIMASLTSAVPAGVTADFTALDPDLIEDPVTGTPTRRNLEVLVSEPSGATTPQLTLVLKDFIKSKDGKSILRTEKAIFNLASADRSNTALIVPFRFDNAASRAVAILVQIGPGTTDASHVAATIDCLKKVSAKLAATQPVLGTGEANARSTVTAAVQSLTPVAGRRSSLAFLAGQTNASLCEDLAMEADDAVLAQLVQSIQRSVATDKSPDPEVGWLLDHTALQLLAKMSDDAANGTGKIPPELTAILTTHTGEVGRHSSSLDELLRGITSRQELDNRLLAENTIFLGDSNPASRVRAYDWLSARHHAPVGYDPLGKGKDRRDALERAAGGTP